MAKLSIFPDSTDVSLLLFIQDSSQTDGRGLTGLVYNSAGLTCYYVRPGATATAVTLATQTVTGAHSNGGFVEIDSTNLPGWYRFDPPDEPFADGVRSVGIQLKGAANMVQLNLEIDLESQVNVMQWVGQDVPTPTVTGTPDVRLVAGAANVISASLLAADAAQEIRDAVTGGAYALDTDANGRIRIVDGTGVGELDTSAGTVTLTDGSLTAAKIASAAFTGAKFDSTFFDNIETAVENELVLNNLDHLMKVAMAGGEIADNSALARLAASDGIFGGFDFTTDSLEAIRDNQQTAAAAALAAFWTSPDTLVDLVWDEVLTGATHNVANSSGRRLRTASGGQLDSGTAAAGGSDTITLATSASTTAGLYVGCAIVIDGGTGAGQARHIIGYTAGRVATVARPWTTAPDGTSTYVLYADNQIDFVQMGLAQAGGATSITLDANASATDDIYNGQPIRVFGGTGKYQIRTITAYNGTTKVATVDRAWQTNPDSTSYYAVAGLTNNLLPDQAFDNTGSVGSVAAGVTLADGAHGGSSTILTFQKIIGAASGNDNCVSLTGSGTGSGFRAAGGATGQGMTLVGGGTSGIGLSVSASNGIGMFVDGGGDSSIYLAVNAGPGGVLEGDITGSLSGSVGSVTGAVGSVTGAVGSVTGSVGGNVTGSVGSVLGGINTTGGTITTLDALDTAQDTQHSTTQAATTAIKAVTDALTAAAAAKLATSAGTMVTGTVDNSAHTPTTTEFEADNITEATADHYNGRIIIFTSGALTGQATDITDYALSGANGHFTVTALTEAPANNDTFIII